MKIFILTLLAAATFVWPIETAILVWMPWCVVASYNYGKRRHKEDQALYNTCKPNPLATLEASSRLPSTECDDHRPITHEELIQFADKVVFAFADFLAEREVNCCPIHDAGELPYSKEIIEKAFHLLVKHYERIKTQSPELADLKFENKLNSIKCCRAVLSGYHYIDQADKPILELLARTEEWTATEHERNEILRVLNKYESHHA